MKEARSAKVQLMVEPSLIGRIDDWRFTNRVGSRSQAMRSLINSGLDAATAKGPAEAPTSPSHDQNHTPGKDGGIDA